MAKTHTTQELSDHYARRHYLRKGLYGDIPYANYGYWIREGMTIDEACAAMTDRLGRELELNAEDELLECGCGYGAGAIQLIKTYGPRRYVGLDVTELRIETGRQMIEDEGLSDRMTMRIGDATNIDLPDASFTKVLAIECAFHFNTREDFFREAFRVLKPGGMLAIADPTVADDIGDLPIEERRDCVAHDARMICDENLYGPSTFKSKLEAVGFGPVRIESIKEHVLEPFANHLERVAATSEPELRERRLIAVERIRKNHCRGGDYVIATAVKPQG